MRSLIPVILVLLGHGMVASAQTTPVCTGLCLQQLPPNSCPNSGTTSISGVVYAPDGTDPLPNVQVYIPNAAVDAFTPGVSCPVVGQPPSGSPLVGTTTATDGSFTITNAPVGTNIPLVIVSGRWRRQLVIPATTSCANTALPMGFASFPQNQSQGDIPKFAIATGSADSVECVLRKVGIADSEFTDASGNGRINLYLGTASHGAQADASTPSETTLMSSGGPLSQYDVLMLPCEGQQYTRTPDQLGNLVSFANAGGRVYSSHYSYAWMWQNPPFNTVVNWVGNQNVGYPDGTLATVNASFSGGATLSGWLNDVGASSGATPAQIGLSAIKHDFSSVNPPTESWLTLDVTGNPVMQIVFDTPIPATGQTVNQCGRILFNEYHVENPTIASAGKTFPAECPTTTALTAQEKLLEYSLFELTNDGGAATLTPTMQDFGTQAIGFNSPVQTFTWTNNSTFTASVSLLTGSGDFNVVSNNCSSVAAYGSCSINMVFNPSALGARTGTLTVGSNGSTLTAALTGTGVPDLSLSTTGLNFGSLDVGATLTQSFTVTNSASGPVPVPAALVLTGDYSAATSCPAILAAGASCPINVTFKPTTTGARPGTLTVQAASMVLSGNGIDFTIADAPASGTTIAGNPSSTVVTTTPIAGFAANLTLSCATNAPGSTCTLSANSFAPVAAVTTNVKITTTSQYTVIGYGGLGGGWLSLIGLATGLLLWVKRRSLDPLVRSGLTMVLLALMLGAASLGMTGCSGKLPAQNAVYTAAGPYTYTVTATDGFLVHSATYTLNVTAK